ncbi:LysR family transcriptional regulator [Archangium gephyra]|uniref:LysR family transcriptional regulator n=1 Tax=Archangium gephyra TaxID=48 RepID=UPI003B7FAD46
MKDSGMPACKNVRMDWDDLRYVLAIHREKTLSGAADALGVSRTTVGRRLKEAEERLGVRLFDRTEEGFAATAAGDELAETAVRLEAEIHVAEGRLLGRDAELRGRLRVSTVDFLFAGFPEVFSSFIQRYPGVEVTLGVTDEQVSLIRREADVALRLDNNPAEGLVGRRVGRLQFEAYAARSLVERVGTGATLADFPWLHSDERSDGHWLDGWLARNAPGARVALRSDDFAVRRRAVSTGMGVTFLACFDGDADPGLVRVGARLSDEARDLWVLTLPELRNNSRIRAFMDHVYDAFKPHQRALEGVRTPAR